MKMNEFGWKRIKRNKRILSWKIRNAVWQKYNKATFEPEGKLKARFWKWIYDCLRGHFSIRTKHGVFGIFWHGFANFDIELGHFFRTTVDYRHKKILISFVRDYYKNNFLVGGKGQAYHRWLFGHTLGMEYGNDKANRYSEWHCGRYTPYASGINTKKTGKLFGLIGYGNEKKKEPIFSFEQPIFPWITSEYAEKNGWYVCSCSKENKCPGGECEFAISDDRVIPCLPRHLLRPGDVVIFFDYIEEGDRYYLLNKEDIREWKEGSFSLLPYGIVVRAPEKPPASLSENFINILKTKLVELKMIKSFLI
ncbi:hypothetical protein KAS79_00660 [Candidatus Parcubacteria bacterium]|nr:hypothetical protein [Candidatus Parcubacteria bacterium]